MLNSRNQELVTLFDDSDTLFQAISARRESIHRLLASTQSISKQLRGLVKKTRSDLEPALDQLDVVSMRPSGHTPLSPACSPTQVVRVHGWTHSLEA